MRNGKLYAALIASAAICSAASGPVSVSGTIVDTRSGIPLPRVHVVLTDSSGKNAADSPGIRYGALTKEDGTFSISGIKPATYTLIGERVGFVPAKGERGHPSVILKENAKVPELRLELTPVGAISGSITGSDGTPLEGAIVVAQGVTRQETTTDENGRFRIGGLAPGGYRIKASNGSPLYRMLEVRPEIVEDGIVALRDATTWYPGVLGAKQAKRVDVRSGEESRNTDIQLTGTPSVRVSGKVSEMPRGAGDPQVNVSSREGWGMGIPMKNDGTFEIWGLDPGRYWISASWADKRGVETKLGPRLSTSAVQIDLDSSNIDDMDLRLVADSDIVGKIETNSPGAMTIQLHQFGSGYPTGEPVPVSSAGDFKLQHVQAGKYVVSVSSDSAYVKSLRLGATEMEGAVLDLTNGSRSAELTIELSGEMALISGSVRDDLGDGMSARVILIEDNDDVTPVSHQVMAGANGSYSLKIAPGAYRIVAVRPDGADFPEYEDSMTPVEVHAGEKRALDLGRAKDSA